MNFEETPSPREIEIRRYLLGQLPPAEKAAVEARISQDAEYASDVRSVGQMVALAQASRLRREQEAGQVAVNEEVRTQVQAAMQRVKMRDARLRRIQVFSAAAAVALLAAFGAYFWMRPPLGKRLFQEYYSAAKPVDILQGGSSDAGLIHYRDGDYPQAIATLSQVPTSDSAYTQARFYLAQAHMAIGEVPAAVEVLKALVKEASIQELLLHEAEWYLALGYLYAGDWDAARGLLNQIDARPLDAKQPIAADILKKLP